MWSPKTNLADYLVYRHIREGRGDNIALIYRDANFTYDQVAQLTAQTASILRARDVKPGDRIILLLSDSPAFIAAFFGTLAIGAIAVPINPALNIEDVSYIASHIDAKMVILNEKFKQKFRSLNYLNTINDIILAGDCHRETSEFEQSLSSTKARIGDIKPAKESLAYCLFSSGTTGKSKGIVHRHTDILHCANSYAIPVLQMTEDDIVLSVPKLTFGYGLGGNLFFTFLVGGTAILIDEPSTPSIMCEIAKQYSPTLMLIQPRMISEILRLNPPVSTFSSLRLCVSRWGGAFPIAIPQVEGAI